MSDKTYSCDIHEVFNAGCNNCISACYGIDPESYYESWMEIIGEQLGCGKHPGMIIQAIHEMVEQETRMKRMIANLRKEKKLLLDDFEQRAII